MARKGVKSEDRNFRKGYDALPVMQETATDIKDGFLAFENFMENNIPLVREATKNGFKLGMVKALTKMSTVGDNQLRTRLKKPIRGIDLEPLTTQTINEVDEMVENGRIYEEYTGLYENLLANNREQLAVYKTAYQQGQAETAGLIDSIQSTPLRMTTQFATGVAEHFGDWTNYMTMAATGAASSAITGAAGLGTVASKAIEYGIFGATIGAQNEVDTRVMEERNPEFTENLTKAAQGVVMKGIIDVGSYGIGRLHNRWWNSRNATNTQQQAPLQLTYNEKQVNIQANDNVSMGGKGSTNTDLFMKKPLEPNQYSMALDPRNPRTNTFDTAFDGNLPNNGHKAYFKDSNGTPISIDVSQNASVMEAKYALDRGLMTQADYAAVVSSQLLEVTGKNPSQLFPRGDIGTVIVPQNKPMGTNRPSIPKAKTEVATVAEPAIVPTPKSGGIEDFSSYKNTISNPIDVPLVDDQTPKQWTAQEQVKVQPEVTRKGDNVIFADEFQETLNNAKKLLNKSAYSVIEEVDSNMVHTIAKLDEGKIVIMSRDPNRIATDGINPKEMSYKEVNLTSFLQNAKVTLFEYDPEDEKGGRFIDVQGHKKLTYYLTQAKTEALDKLTKSVMVTGNGLQQAVNLATSSTREKNQGNRNAKINLRANKIVHQLSASSTEFEFVQHLWTTKEASKNSILTSMNSTFEAALSPYYRDVASSIDDIAFNELTRAFVTGQFDSTMINDPTLINEKTEGWKKVLKRYLDMNAMVTGISKGMNIAEDTDTAQALMNALPNYPKVFTTNDNGEVVFSTAPDSLFGKYGEDNIVLDLYLNPNKVGIGASSAEDIGNMEYFKDYNLKSMDEIDRLILSQYSVDQINAMAVKKVFGEGDQNLLREYGILTMNTLGDEVVPLENFVIGVTDILEDYQNAVYNGDGSKYQSLIEGLTTRGKLPNKVFIAPEQGTIEVQPNLLDFFTNNQDVTFTLSEFSKLAEPIMISTAENLEADLNDLDIRERQAVYSSIDGNDKLKMEAINVANKIIRGVNRYKDANKYLLSPHFEKNKKRLMEIGAILNQDLNGLIKVDDFASMEGVTYKGKVADYPEFKSIFSQALKDSKKIQTAVEPVLKSVSDMATRMNGSDLKKFVRANKFKTNLAKIIANIQATNVGVDTQALEDLLNFDTTQYTAKDKTMFRDALNGAKRQLQDIYNLSKSSQAPLKNIYAQLAKTQNPTTSLKSKSFTENYDLAKGFLNGYLSNQELNEKQYNVNDLDDFLVEGRGETGSEITKSDLLYTLRNQISDLEDYLGDLPMERIETINEGFNGLRATYTELLDKLNNNSANSVNFFKNLDIDKYVTEIQRYNAQAGYPFSEAELLKGDIFNFFKGLYKSLRDSKQYNPINNFKQKDFTRFTKTTTVGDLDMQRLAAAINKDKWFNDLGMFVAEDFESNLVKSSIASNNGLLPSISSEIENFEDLTKLPADLTKEFVKPHMQGRMETLHSYAAPLFKPVVLSVDEATGEPLETQMLDLDQFTVVYYNFLQDLKLTRDISRGITRLLGKEDKHLSDLLPYFNNKEDMIKFFTQEVPQRYGYVKTNAEILDLMRDKAANSLAEYTTFGSTQLGFGYMLKNTNNAILANSLYKNREQNVKTGKYIDVNDVHKTMLLDIGEKLIQNAIPRTDWYQDKKMKSNDFARWMGNLVSLAKTGIMFGVGAPELVAKNYMTLKRIYAMDVYGRSSRGGATDRALALLGAAAKGAGDTLKLFPSILADTGASAYNALIAIDRAMGVEKAINKIFNKDIDLSLNINRGMFTKEKMLRDLSKVVGDQHTIYMAHKSYDQSKEINQAAKRSTMSDMERMSSIYFNESNTVQEIAQKFAFFYSYGHATNEVKGIMQKNFTDLAGETQNLLRRSGVDHTNFLKFKSFIKEKVQNSNGDFKYDLLSLNGIQAEEFSLADIPYMDALTSVFTSFHNQGFEENRYLKFSKTDSLGRIMNDIYGAFKHTVFGVGLDDVLKLVFSQDDRGVYKSKLFGNFNRTPSQYMGMLGRGMLVGAGAGMGLALMGFISPVLHAFLKDRKNVPREIAKSYGDLKTIGQLANLPEMERDQAIQQIKEVCGIVMRRATNNLAFSVYLDDGQNILQNLANMALTVGHDINLALVTGGLDPEITNFWLPDVTFQEANGSTFPQSLKVMVLNAMGLAPLAYFKGDMDFFRDERRRVPALEAKRVDKNIRGDSAGEITTFNRLETLETLTRGQETMYDAFYGMVDAVQNGRALPTYEVDFGNMKQWDDMSEEEQTVKALVWYEGVTTTLAQQRAEEMGIAFQLRMGINDMLYDSGYYSEEDYINTAVQNYQDMMVDDQYNMTPNIYKRVFDDIIANNDDYNEKEKYELKVELMTARHEKKPLRQIIAEFAKTPQDIYDKYDHPSKKQETKKQNKRDAKSFDQLPNLYKKIYQEFLNRGMPIDENEMVKMYNEGVTMDEYRQKLNYTPSY